MAGKTMGRTTCSIGQGGGSEPWHYRRRRPNFSLGDYGFEICSTLPSTKHTKQSPVFDFNYNIISKVSWV